MLDSFMGQVEIVELGGQPTSLGLCVMRMSLWIYHIPLMSDRGSDTDGMASSLCDEDGLPFVFMWVITIIVVDDQAR
jgi:hypothetical protein